ncbi:MAG: (2Fe-2S)-binding protein [Gemmatimonadaceae bacterium]|nr:(2Fe-2S)-binding protein [Gemmatimonadaceae bacterium]
MLLTVNGRPRQIDVPDDESLLMTLRERLALTGAKAGCDRGECGACTVHVDGEPVYACLVLTRAIEGAHITTIEGLAATADVLHPVQRAFVSCDAVQCGFCTPGQVMAAVALLERSPSPTEAEIAEAMSGNLCRCGTYPSIRRAILEVVSSRAADPAVLP